MRATLDPDRYTAFDGPALPRPGQVVGLVDVRCMYVSCERIFNPALRGTPTLLACIRLDSV